MHPYEIVLILRPEGTEEQLKQAVARVEELIKKEGGAVTATEPWGRRRLAFPIKKQREGVYYLLRANADPLAIDRLKRSLRLEEAIVRVMIVRATLETPMTAPARSVTLGARPEWAGAGHSN